MEALAKAISPSSSSRGSMRFSEGTAAAWASGGTGTAAELDMKAGL